MYIYIYIYVYVYCIISELKYYNCRRDIIYNAIKDKSIT